MPDLSLAQFIVHLEKSIVAVHAETHHALEQAAKLVEAEAKREVGHYQDAAGPFVKWAELSDVTKADRVAKGFSANDPLLRTGEMRDSIKHTVRMTGIAQGEAHIGSDSDIALYQEVGTRKIPPRSFLGGALYRKVEDVKNICGKSIVTALVGKAIASLTFDKP